MELSFFWNDLNNFLRTNTLILGVLFSILLCTNSTSGYVKVTLLYTRYTISRYTYCWFRLIYGTCSTALNWESQLEWCGAVQVCRLILLTTGISSGGWHRILWCTGAVVNTATDIPNKPIGQSSHVIRSCTAGNAIISRYILLVISVLISLSSLTYLFLCWSCISYSW